MGASVFSCNIKKCVFKNDRYKYTERFQKYNKSRIYTTDLAKIGLKLTKLRCVKDSTYVVCAHNQKVRTEKNNFPFLNWRLICTYVHVYIQIEEFKNKYVQRNTQQKFLEFQNLKDFEKKP